MFNNDLLLIFSYLLMHWCGYVFASLILFSIISLFKIKLNSVFNLKVFKQHSGLHLVFLLTTCSLIGIPPLFGFWTKLLILLFIGACGQVWLILSCWLVIFLSLCFYLSAFRHSISTATISKSLYFTNEQVFYLIFLCCCLLLGVVFFNQIVLLVYLLLI